MGKQSKKKKKKITRKLKDYEGCQYGPLRIERFGRYVRMSSNWRPGEHEKHIENIKSKRPELKDKIDIKIRELLTIIEQNDPLELLASISIKNCLADPEQYTESTHEGRECYVEFALSIITSHNKHGFGIHATKETIDKFEKLISDIFNKLFWYFGTEFTENKLDRVEEELRFRSILNFIFVRGDSFQEHHLDLVNDLFKPHDRFLKKYYGSTTNEIIEGVNEIEKQVLCRLKNILKGAQNMKDLHNLFKEFVDEIDIEKFSSIEEYFNQFRSLPDVQKKHNQLEEFKNNLEEIPFEIKANWPLTKEIIELLTLGIGENREFLTFDKTPGWPSNDSLIYTRPLIKHNDKIYCFMPQLLFRNIGKILEDWIKQKDKQYYDKNYQSTRADYLEKKALEYFAKILPTAKIYGKLYYIIEENAQKKRVETDGIILYDNNLFILEGKAGTLSLSARRGGMERMKKDAAELIGSAYSQALRTKNIIETNEKPRFEDEKGSEILTILDKSNIKKIFLVNVTLESLGDLSTRLNSLKHLKLIQGKEWSWAVFINDLRVISEVIESPSEFLTFIQRRIRANDFPQFVSADELDFLMFFLNEGLYFEDVIKNDNINITPHAYTEPLDRYYDFLAGRVSSGEKPILRTSTEFKKLIKNIEALEKEGFTTVTTTLLDFSGETHEEIIKTLNHIRQLSEIDGKTHDATFFFKDDRIGVTFFMGPDRSGTDLERMQNHCIFKMYQTKYENWLAITIDSAGEITSPYDFFIFQRKWIYDEQLEKKLREFKKWKWEKSGMIGQKIGRNQICPCGSELKYKKCCGK